MNTNLPLFQLLPSSLMIPFLIPYMCCEFKSWEALHVLLRVFHLSVVHVTSSHVGLTCAFKACIISAVRLESWRANNDTKPAVSHKDRHRIKDCSQAPSKVYLKSVRFSHFYSPYRHKNWCHAVRSLMLTQGQGSPPACPLMGTHLGCQTVRRFVYLFFPPFSSLTISAQLTGDNWEQGVFVRHRPVWR